jgi:hypothetical protein
MLCTFHRSTKGRKDQMKERAAIRKWLKENPETAAEVRDLIETGKLVSLDDPAADEVVTIICGQDHGGIDGSVQRGCAECGAIVWMSPSMQEAIAKRGLKELENDAQAG